jgi:hypothetical protein
VTRFSLQDGTDHAVDVEIEIDEIVLVRQGLLKSLDHMNWVEILPDRQYLSRTLATEKRTCQLLGFRHHKQRVIDRHVMAD